MVRDVLLCSTRAIRARLQTQYDHVLIDEYQDVNRSSVRLLTALRDNGDNLWVVGDAKQSIYRFRGASSFNMARFGKEDFAGGLRGRLKRNYRSVYEMVDAFSTFALGMKTEHANSGLEADRGASGQKPELRTVDLVVLRAHESRLLARTVGNNPCNSVLPIPPSFNSTALSGRVVSLVACLRPRLSAAEDSRL